MTSWVLEGDPALAALRSQTASSAENQVAIDAAIVTYVKVRTRFAMRRRLCLCMARLRFAFGCTSLTHERRFCLT